MASKGLDMLSDLSLLLKLIQNENKVVGLLSKAIRIQFLFVLRFFIKALVQNIQLLFSSQDTKYLIM